VLRKPSSRSSDRKIDRSEPRRLDAVSRLSGKEQQHWLFDFDLAGSRVVGGTRASWTVAKQLAAAVALRPMLIRGELWLRPALDARYDEGDKEYRPDDPSAVREVHDKVHYNREQRRDETDPPSPHVVHPKTPANEEESRPNEDKNELVVALIAAIEPCPNRSDPGNDEDDGEHAGEQAELWPHGMLSVQESLPLTAQRDPPRYGFRPPHNPQ
jgi:hypothetical protein